MSRLVSLPSRRAAGFSLVELMVGIVVAMAAVVVVMQVFKVTEGQRRNTTGGDDAATTGAIAVSLLQRDLRQAGQGFLNPQMLGCRLNLGNNRNVGELVPVQINPAGIPAGDENTDVLLISYGSGWGAPEGSRIVSQTGPSTYNVGAPQAYQVGDRVVATPGIPAGACILELTSLAAAPAGNAVTVSLGIAGASNGTLLNMGRAPRFVAYAVRSSRLTACELLVQNCNDAAPDNWTEVADNIVSLRAEYAIDNSATSDLIVDTYGQAAPMLFGATCAWARVIGVRFALVARSRQAETADIPTAAPTWSAGASTPITLEDGWQRFRYKTFETTVPLRNMPASFAGCRP
ncbi:PilW family protein [Roseateles sp. P5_E7]